MQTHHDSPENQVWVDCAAIKGVLSHVHSRSTLSLIASMVTMSCILRIGFQSSRAGLALLRVATFAVVFMLGGPICGAEPSPAQVSRASHEILAGESTTALAANRLATHHYAKGEFKQAAKLYLEAYKINPKASYLFNLARSEMRDFQNEHAKKNFQQYLERKDTSAKGRKRARLHLEEIAAYQSRLKAAESKASMGTDSVTLGLWIGSAVLATTSGVLYGVAYKARLQTNREQPQTAAGVQTIINEQEQQSILRWVSVGAVTVSAALGAWALKRSLTKSTDHSIGLSLWTEGRGLSIEGRF
ncbi:MAG: hypothetical protein CMH53_02220 [Myxococcales bacterium]|nr:hypothetical protein [Myxococcales bacterium]